MKNHVAKFKYLKYTAISLLTALLAVLTLATPAMAFDSGNYTSVDIIFSDNVTIESINGSLTLTITDLEEVLLNVAEEHAGIMVEGMTSLLEYFVMFLLLLAIAAFGYWHKDKVMLILASFGFMLFGFMLWDGYWWLSMVTVGAGMYLFVKAFWDKRGKNNE